MKPAQQYTLIVIFLINTFFIQASMSTYSLVFAISSLVLVVFILFKEPSFEADASNISRHENDVVEANTSLSTPDFHAVDKNIIDKSRISHYLKLVQSIMKFDGALYFEHLENNELKYVDGLVRHASVATSKHFVIDGTYPGELLRYPQSHLNTDLNESSINYYTDTKKTRKELFSVPYIENDKILGIFVFDSCEKDTFTKEVADILQGMAQLIQSTGKLPVEITDSIANNDTTKHQLYELGNSVYNEHHFYELVKHVLPALFTAKNLFIVKKSDTTRSEIVSILGNVEGYNLRSSFGHDEGVIGWGLKNSKFVQVDNLVRDERYTIRFADAEKKPKLTKSLIFQPLLGRSIYGIGLESDKINGFTDTQKQLLQSLAEPLTAILEHALKRQKLLANSMYDTSDQVFSSALFRVLFNNQQKLFKRHDINYSVSLLVLDYSNYLQDHPKDIVTKYVINEVIKLSRSSDSLFKYSQRILILFLPFTDEVKQTN
jgi:putative methionine-R-sulfoxide reductase with GAF domain